jgi:medium-chain acyl-[acyl-carrier-protein] hydrolase
MEHLWESLFKVKAFDVDSNNRIKVSTVFDYFQDAASNHAEQLKFGYDDLLPKNLFWVLSWAKIEFTQFPKFMDEVKVQTWGKMQYKLYSMRDFLLLNKEDEIICRATTGWLLLDLKTLRPKILDQEFPDVVHWYEKAALFDMPGKFPVIAERSKVYTKKINYSDIDLNQHVNNAKYIELLLDCYDFDFHKGHRMKSLTISFMSESKYGEKIELGKGIQNDNTDFIEATNLKTQKVVFKSLVNWY